MISVSIPPIILTRILWAENPANYKPIHNDEIENMTLEKDWTMVIRIALYHPLIYANILFMLFICIQFWLISLIQ